MVPTPSPAGFALAAVLTVIAVAASVYWQPDAPTPVMVQAAFVFLAVSLALGRFRPFRRR